jgi:hypothetical protein
MPKNNRPLPVPSLPTQADQLATLLLRHFSRRRLNALAKKVGFLRRKDKKLSPLLLLQSACLLVVYQQISLRLWAALVGLLGGFTLSKQALQERLTDKAVRFLQGALAAFLATPLGQSGLKFPQLRLFKRVILHDSTGIQAPEKIADVFPGANNQKGSTGGYVKIQAYFELLSQQFVHFSLGSFRDNDQGAASHILPWLQAADLVVRDLGYLAVSALEKIQAAKAFFISRLRLDATLWLPDGRTRLDLLAYLRRHQRLDRQLLWGDTKFAVRVLAIPLPPAVAAERRRKAKANAKRDGRCVLSARYLALLGWAIFITNVPAQKLDPVQIAKIYGLRWRIEIVFKAWKSHFKMTELPEGSAATIQVLVYGRLLFIALFHTCFWRADTLKACQSEATPPSLLKLAQLLATTLLTLVLGKLKIDWAASFTLQLQYHCRYEKRRRGHFFSALANLSSSHF